MLHEVYTPHDEAALAWSRQKINALKSTIDGIYLGTKPPCITLLYGPPGCGKLCSLKVLLRAKAAALQASNSPEYLSVHRSEPGEVNSSAGVRTVSNQNLQINVFHTAESSFTLYHQFLRSILRCCYGDEKGRSLSSGTDKSVAVPLSKGTPSARLTAHIIKFYGEHSTDALHRLTTAFVRQYEELRGGATWNGGGGRRQKRDTNGQRCTGPYSASPLSGLLQRHLVFFIHTIHDTHSEKVDLHGAFPFSVLRSLSVELFHCTRITDLNMKKRIRSIMEEEEANRRGRVATSTALESTRVGSKRTTCTLASSSLRAPRVKNQRTPMETTKRLSSPCCSTLLYDDQLECICAASQGDIRQALLQMQWVMLLPHKSTPMSCNSDTMYDEGLVRVGRRLETVTRSMADDRCTLDEVSAKLETDTIATHSDAVSDGPLLDDSSDESVVCISDVHRSTSAITSCSPLAAAARSSVRAQQTIRDIFDADMDALNEGGAVKIRKKNVCPTSEGKDVRATVSTSRDAFMGLAHTTARLLTQTYTMDDVVTTLNVNPRKLISYLSNNLHNYFSPTQLCEYEACVASVSAGDALRAVDAAYAGSNYRRNQLSDRTSTDDYSAVEQQLDGMVLRLFDAAYRYHHREVCVPRNFVAQRPPPFQRSAYPRQREKVGTASSMRRKPQSGDEGPEKWTEDEWQESFFLRLEAGTEDASGIDQGTFTHRASGAVASTPRLSSEDIDILREGMPDPHLILGPLHAVVEDYAPFAQLIVLTNREMARSSEAGGHEGSSLPASSPKHVSFALSRGHDNMRLTPTLGRPKRTTFTLSSLSRDDSVSETLSPPRRKRPCSELCFRILQRGCPHRFGLREDAFVIARRGTMEDGLWRSGTEGEEQVPLLPKDDVIDDFSD